MRIPEIARKMNIKFDFAGDFRQKKKPGTTYGLVPYSLWSPSHILIVFSVAFAQAQPPAPIAPIKPMKTPMVKERMAEAPTFLFFRRKSMSMS